MQLNGDYKLLSVVDCAILVKGSTTGKDAQNYRKN